MGKIISIGAEAILEQQGDKLVKKRVKKGYRYPELDEKLRKLRTRKEAKLLEKAAKIISVPAVTKVDDKAKEIFLDFIDGRKLSEALDSFNLAKAKKFCLQIGNSAAKLHDAGIIHGDLTTSNMILSQGKIFFIDFGLGFESSKTEDKAVDLHLLRQAFESKHYEKWQDYFSSAIEGYKISKNADAVLKQLEKVESRGRYKGKH